MTKQMTATVARNSTTQWRAADVAHHLHPFTDHKGLASEGGSRIVTKAEGVWLEDSEGERLLDGMAGLWCVNLGYGREELARAAYDQMLELPYYNTFFKTATPPAVELSEKLAALTPAGLNKAFFASSGSEANDTIVRLARRYWRLKGQPEKNIMISRVNAYHGSTCAAASLSGMRPMHEVDGLPLPGFVHIQQPYWFEEGGDLDPEAFGLQAARALEEKIDALGADKVAAFIGEPIQGAGGVIVPPACYWAEIQRICRERDILLIADEVICGFGRTGHWFGSNLFEITPDLMPMAKGLTSGYLPLSAVMVSDKVCQVLDEKGGEISHGFTYSGHPVACAVALKNLEIMERENVIGQVHDDTGPYFQARLRELKQHPLVGEVRGVGLIAGIQLSPDKARRGRFEKRGAAGLYCRDACVKHKIVSRAVADSMVLSPPLIITREEIDELFRRMRQALNDTARFFGVT